MADPKGKLYTIVAYDDDGNPVALRVNATGELMTVISGGSGSGNPAEAKGRLFTPVAFDPDLVPVALETDEYGQLKIALEGVGGYTEGARVYNSANLAIPNITWTPLTFNSERWDTDDIHSVVSDTHKLVCKTAGKYLISVSVSWQAHTTGLRYLAIYLQDGSTVIARDGRDPIQTAAHPTCINITTIHDMAVDEWVYSVVYQSSGVSSNVRAAPNWSPEFMMQRIG